jgi:hypothetical protein
MNQSSIDVYKDTLKINKPKDEMLKEFYSYLKFRNIFQDRTNLKNVTNSALRINTNSSEKTVLSNPQRVLINNSIQSKKDSFSKKEEINNYVAPKFEQTVSEAVYALNAQKSAERKYIKFLNNFGKQFKSIVGKLVYRTKILSFNKEIGIVNQKNVYQSIKKKIISVKKKILEIDRKSQQRVIITEHYLQKLREKINEYILSDQFIEDYSSSDIRDNYIIYNNLKGLGKTAKWDYYMYNVEGHLKTISQKGSFIDSMSVSLYLN